MDRDHGKLLAMLQAEFQGAIATHAHAANATTSAMIDGIEMLIDETDDWNCGDWNCGTGTVIA